MIYHVLTPYLIYENPTLEVENFSCICRSSDGFVRHLLNIQLAPRPTRQGDLTDGKNCVLP